MSTQKRALIVVTSHSQLGDTGKPTGYYLPEVTHPYAALTARGIQVDIASIAGGTAPLDQSSLQLTDPVNKQFWETPATRAKLEQTLPLGEVAPAQYQAVLFAGGHGTMWDFPDQPRLASVAATIYERGGVVGAVALVGAMLALAFGAAGALGVIVGGMLTDRLRARDPAAYLGVPALASLASTPCFVAAAMIAAPLTALGFLSLGIVISSFAMAPVLNLLNDAYNANPASAREALAMLDAIGGDRPRVAGAPVRRQRMHAGEHRAGGIGGVELEEQRAATSGVSDNSGAAEDGSAFQARGIQQQ